MAKVMIVDDDKDVIELLSFVLEKDGYTVFRAFNGRDALEQLGVLPSAQMVVKPDVVILDIMMPEIDGYTVQNRMSEHDETRSIPIIILTAKGLMRDLFGLASNVAAYIDKPFDPSMLREKIKEIENS